MTCSLALACDFRIASGKARFSKPLVREAFPQIAIGIAVSTVDHS